MADAFYWRQAAVIATGVKVSLALAAEAEGIWRGIKATDLFLLTSGSLDLLVSGGSDIAASGKVLAFGGQFASMVGDSSGSSIRVHDINLHAWHHRRQRRASLRTSSAWLRRRRT